MEQELLVVLHSVKCRCRGASWVAMPATVVSQCPEEAGRVVLAWSQWQSLGKPRNTEDHARCLGRTKVVAVMPTPRAGRA